MATAPAAEPFRLPGLMRGLSGRFGNAVRAGCECALAFPELNAIYAQAREASGDGFCTRALRALGVRIQISAGGLDSIPKRGPLVVVANHPFGGLDGLILTELLGRVRSDARVLANYLLARVPEMSETCLFVDPFGGPSAGVRNYAAIRSAVKRVAEGGALGVFPAGEVSHFTLKRGCVTDPPWSDFAARLALETRATVVPLYFAGRNSRRFQILGLVHPRLRTALLPRELLRLRGQTIRVEVGTPITPERLARLHHGSLGGGGAAREGAKGLTEYLRLRTYILAGRAPAGGAAPAGRPGRAVAARPIAAAAPVAALSPEVSGLPAEQCLATSGSLQVWVGSAGQLPGVVREIGRLRESTFRLVGEGTGREIDLDRFDAHYLHLFVWNAEAHRIVGAYRMGQSDALLKRFGVGGLYTSTLFRYRPRLLDQLTPALELGRSFVIPECQRDYAPLLLLWKGIGRFVARHPRYRRLFGAVSISDDFQSLTKQLLMAFLRAHSFDEALAALVRPKAPPRLRRFPHAAESRLATLVSDVADVEELVGEIESNGRGVPVLLRQYLRLNAKLLGFNIDPDFGDVVDGLVLVDLTKVERPILNRYMGPDGAAAFLDYHAGQSRDGS